MGMHTTTGGGGADLYAVLGVLRTATSGQIKSAYMELAKQHHPDRVMAASNSEAVQKKAHLRFTNITSAYQVLGDALARREYDAVNMPLGGNPSRPWEHPQYAAHRQASGQGAYREGEFYEPGEGGFTPKADRWKFLSNTGVVVAACVWMVGGALTHFFRFNSAADEVKAAADENSKTAAEFLNSAYAGAKEKPGEGGNRKLQELRDARDHRRAVHATANSDSNPNLRDGREQRRAVHAAAAAAPTAAVPTDAVVVP